MEEKIEPPVTFPWRIIVEIFLVAFVLSILAAILTPLHHGSRENARRASCQSNLKQIMLSVKQYIGDYDQKYPPVALESEASFVEAGNLSSFGWVDGLRYYRLSSGIFQCPSEKVPPTKNQLPQIQTEGLENLKPRDFVADKAPLQSQYTDYWFNARASGVGEKQIQQPGQTIILGDGNDGTDSTNARYNLMSIPQKWRKDEESPLHRHLDGANYAFADGHVKWFRADRWKTELDMEGGPTFRLKPKN